MPTSDTATESADFPQKISAEFAARLARLAADEQIRVLVLTRRSGAESNSPADTGSTPAAPRSSSRAPSRSQLRTEARTQNAAAAREAVEDAFEAVDDTLAAAGGARVTREPNALGHIAVETTRAGVEALCRLDCVATILEDQPIHPHKPVPRAE